MPRNEQKAWAKSAGRNGATRCPIERMAFIAECLRSATKFTSVNVAEKLEINRRTVNRDIEFMRDRIGFEIEYDFSKQTFVGKPPSNRVL